ARASGSIPITIGGDHSLAIGSIAGAANHSKNMGENMGLFWFDAHGDINTPVTTPSGNVHGMPLAVALGYGDDRLTQILDFSPKVAAENVALIGIRDLDAGEKTIICEAGIKTATMRDIDLLGMGSVVERSLRAIPALDRIHLSFDIDSIDPQHAPG